MPKYFLVAKLGHPRPIKSIVVLNVAVSNVLSYAGYRKFTSRF